MFKKIDIKRLRNSTSDPFQIIISVFQDRSNIIDVGYGVSQILPLIVETLINDESRFFIFQQPEVHLHPRAQAELGSYFANYAIGKQKYLLLETHSDYIIDRIKSDLISQKKDVNKLLSVLFFERDSLETKITPILFDDKGNVISAPDSYRKFFITESIRTLGL
jgi:predicted ATPase